MDKITSPIKVIICDDHVLYRAGVKAALSSKKNIEVIAEADHGLHLLNLLKHSITDVVLLDIQMPVMDGIQALPEIIKLCPSTKVIMLTMIDDYDMITTLMEIGANSYLSKDSDSEVIYEAINSCHTEGYYFNSLTNNAILAKLKKLTQTPPNLNLIPKEFQLNDKEKLILSLICEEKSIREIADLVDLSPRTVEAIKDKIKVKSGAKTKVDLILFAVKNNLIETDNVEKKYKLSDIEMLKLFSLSTSILTYINHDLAGQKNALFFAINQIKDDINSLKNPLNKITKIDINKLFAEALIAISKIGLINAAIKSHFYWRSNNEIIDINKFFITRVDEIVDTLVKKYEDIVITIESNSPKFLDIVFPPQILLAIVSELIENSKKNNPSDLKISLKWNIEGGKFHFEIADNGKGFSFLERDSVVDLENIFKTGDIEITGLGLNIINKTIKEIEGKAFLSNSKILNGAKIILELPIIDFKYSNTMNRKLSTLSLEQMKKIFSLSTSILSYVNLDLEGQKNVLHTSLSKIKAYIDNNKLNLENQGKIKQAIDALIKIGSISNVIKSHYYAFNSSDRGDFRKLFITELEKIVEIIKNRYSEVKIDIHKDSTANLEIVYPPQIMLAILSELTENAKKNSKENLEICICWNLKGKIFKCEFHDNGPGFPNLKYDGYVSLNSLKVKETKTSGMGLSIINRTIYDSGGQLFFSKSKDKKGAKIYFEFPIIDFNSK